MMTEQELKIIEDKLNEINLIRPEPWRVLPEDYFVNGHNCGVASIEYGPENDKSDCYDLLEDPNIKILEFFVSCREWIPELIKEIRNYKNYYD